MITVPETSSNRKTECVTHKLRRKTMKKKVVLACLLMASVCGVYAQNMTLAPEAGISAVQRYGWGQEWRPSAKIGVAADFNLTRHFGIESGLFYTFRGYSISNGGTYSNENSTWIENVSQTRHFLQIPVMAQFRWNLNKDTKLFFGVGPYVAFCLKNKFDSNPYYLKGNTPGMHEQYYDGFVYGKDAWGNDNLYLYDEARRFDWGVSSNIGIETHHWYAKLQYDLSLGKEGKNDVIGANYHTLTLSVGYKFGL